MTIQQLATLLAAIGAGTVLRDVVGGGIRWLSGAAGRERGRNADLVKQRDDAYARALDEQLRADAERTRADAERDLAIAEARNRNAWADHASALRRAAIDAGVDPAVLPPAPIRPLPGGTP